MLLLDGQAAPEGAKCVVSKFVNPRVPKEAVRMNLAGSVSLAVDVSKHGDVVNIEVLESEPGETFVSGAVSAVESWKFDTSAYDGILHAMRCEVQFVFKEPRPHLEDEEIIVGKPVVTVPPDHPDAERLACNGGPVKLRYRVTKSGEVTDAVVVYTAAGDVLTQSALNAIRAWKFEPSTKAGVPVDVSHTIKFSFPKPAQCSERAESAEQ